MNRLFGPTGAPGAAGLLAQNTSGAAKAVLPATQVVTGTTETVVLNPAMNSATQALILNIPPGISKLEGRLFEVIASGKLHHGASSTVVIKLYSGTSTTVGSDTALGTSGTIGAFSGDSNWYLKASLIFDSTSGKLNGSIKFNVNATLVAEAEVSAVITSVSNSNNPVLSFVLTVTFGTGNAANSITVQEFGAYAA